jgi:hypothetical protein
MTMKALHWCDGDTSSFLGAYPTATCPELYVGCKLGLNFSSCIRIMLICTLKFCESSNSDLVFVNTLQRYASDIVVKKTRLCKFIKEE